tara:strand:- start:2022 stop:2195 length:174 start_codon:yes stop_codon:yes gene_type:complete
LSYASSEKRFAIPSPIDVNPNAIKINLGFIFAGNGYHELMIFLFRMIEAKTKPILAV